MKLAFVFAFIFIFSNALCDDRPPKGPKFEEEPSDSFLVKPKFVNLKCRAYDVLRVWFECNSGREEEIRKRESEHSYNDPETGKRIIEKFLNVTRHELEELERSRPSIYRKKGSDLIDLSQSLYQCWCKAFGESHKIHIESRKATVQFSFLRRNFISEPTSESVEVGTEVRLSCIPPEGYPKPSIFWIKNDKLIRNSQINAAISKLHRSESLRRKSESRNQGAYQSASNRIPGNRDDNDGASLNDEDSNYLITNDGSLIIKQARLTDHGNYTCAAANAAGVRHSLTASLVVYVNGSWSDWSPWSNCSAKCGRGVQKRFRECSAPPAIAGGIECIGESVQVMDCNNPCTPIDGQWSSWTVWSTCSHECQQVRRRTCNSPAPKYGGRDCIGTDLHMKNCTGGMCRKMGLLHQYRHHEEISDINYPRSSSSQVNGQSEIYILCTAIVISTGLLCLAVFIFLTLRQRRYKNHTSYIDDRGEDDGHAMLLLMQKNQQPPDLIRNGGNGHAASVATGEKMYLISRLNNYYSNILDHVVVSNDQLLATANGLSEETALNTSKNSPSVNCTSVMSTPKMVTATSVPSVATTSAATTTTTSNTTNSEDDTNEPDYAEPMVPDFPLPFTPERKPPLPSTCPPPPSMRFAYAKIPHPQDPF